MGTCPYCKKKILFGGVDRESTIVIWCPHCHNPIEPYEWKMKKYHVEYEFRYDSYDYDEYTHDVDDLKELLPEVSERLIEKDPPVIVVNNITRYRVLLTSLSEFMEVIKLL